MTQRLKTALYRAGSIAFLLALWEFLARLVNLPFVLPGVLQTAAALWKLFPSVTFYVAIGQSLLRILTGFLLGTFLGAALVYPTHKWEPMRHLIGLCMTIVKSTPVASFILVIWCLFGAAPVPLIVAVLMVAPVVWHNLTEGLKAIDPALRETADVFGLRGWRRFRYLVFPVLLKFLIPATVSAGGLAWKAGIAAEIIAYTPHSVGKEILTAKSYFEGAQMFAWTLTVIFLSLGLEYLLRKAGQEVMKRCHLS